MNDTTTTAAALDQADEEILTPTFSDDALEAATGPAMAANTDPHYCHSMGVTYSMMCCG
jgi:hypothetical protein